MSVVRRYMRVRGRVQGVAFRAFTQAEAARLGLSGYVRNTPDGDVELEAQGETAALDRLETAVSRGPSAARVDRLNVEPRPLADPPEPGFRIAF